MIHRVIMLFGSITYLAFMLVGVSLDIMFFVNLHEMAYTDAVISFACLMVGSWYYGKCLRRFIKENEE